MCVITRYASILDHTLARTIFIPFILEYRIRIHIFFGDKLLPHTLFFLFGLLFCFVVFNQGVHHFISFLPSTNFSTFNFAAFSVCGRGVGVHLSSHPQGEKGLLQSRSLLQMKKQITIQPQSC